MIMSNDMILPSLTDALIILIRINWGLEAGCTCKPSLWPLPGLLPLNWESLCRRSWASSAWTLPFLKSTASWKQVKEVHNSEGVILETMWCVVGGMDAPVVCVSKWKEPSNKKICGLEAFLCFFWSFARHTGFVAAGNLLILGLV